MTNGHILHDFINNDIARMSKSIETETRFLAAKDWEGRKGKWRTTVYLIGIGFSFGGEENV